MHFSTIAATGLLALAAFASNTADAQPRPHGQAHKENYKALGTEPFWSLTISQRTMTFDAPGRRPVTVPTPRVINGVAGEIYKTRRVSVNIVHKRCSDGMSDRTYPDTVQVTVDGRRYQGCGGDAAVAIPRSVVDGSWRIETIAGKRVVRGTSPEIRFDDGRVTGNTGCNSFNGSFRMDSGRLNAGPLATTRRACLGTQQNAQERTLIALLGERLTVSRNRAGKLVMTGRSGRTLVLAEDRTAGRR